MTERGQVETNVHLQTNIPNIYAIADAKTDEILGVHIIGVRATDMIAACVVAMEFRVSSEDIARTSHTHRSFTEAIKEACMAVDGRAIHS